MSLEKNPVAKLFSLLAYYNEVSGIRPPPSCSDNSQVVHRDVSQLAEAIAAPERRQALDGYVYTAEEFKQHYEHNWEQVWVDRAQTSVQPTLESQGRGVSHDHVASQSSS